MDSLYLLIPLAVILVGLAIWALFWAVRSGQYDDLDTDGRRILFDDQDHPPAALKNREEPGAQGRDDE
jgi:cbb3-type cytochrome oxidase maturation protein